MLTQQSHPAVAVPIRILLLALALPENWRGRFLLLGHRSGIEEVLSVQLQRMPCGAIVHIAFFQRFEIHAVRRGPAAELNR